MCPTPTSLQRLTRRRLRSGRSLTEPGSTWPRGGRGYRSIVPSTSRWSSGSWRRCGAVICRCCSTCSHPTWCWSPTAAARWPLSGVRWWAATEWRPSSPASRRSRRMRWSALCGSTARPPRGSTSTASSTRRSAWRSRTAGSPASTRAATRTSSPGWTKRPRSAAERRTVLGSGLLAAGGMLLALATTSPALVVGGFLLVGLALAAVAPLAFSAAGDLVPGRAGAAISVVTTFGYGGFLLGPPLVGGLAEVVGLRAALGVIVVAGLAVFILSSNLREPGEDQGNPRSRTP